VLRSATDYGKLLEAVRGMTWPSRRPVRTGAPGAHRSRLRGVSPEFSEYRPYRQGDDPRRLDWKLLARTDRAFLRLATDRATLPTVLLLDATASMVFPDGAAAKWAQAQRVAMGLAAIALGAGDPVGVTIAGGAGSTVWRTQPRTRAGTLGRIAAALAEAEPGGGPSDTLATEVEQVRWATRVVVLSDFLDETVEPPDRPAVRLPGGALPDGLVAALRTLAAAGVETHAVHVVAREELAPERATFVAVDPESPSLRRPLVAESVEEYVRRFAAWRDVLAGVLRDADVAYHLVVNDEPAVGAVRRLTASRSAR
jgi:uncharacterized protein (DUF58 family)